VSYRRQVPVPLLPETIDGDVGAWLDGAGHLFARFGRTASGNVAYGAEVDGARWFVKTAGDPGDQRSEGHAARVERLRTGAEIARSVEHRAVPLFVGTVESATGPVLVYAWAEGESLDVPRDHRGDPDSAAARFRALPLPVVLDAIEDLHDLHVALAERGWVAGDLYAASLLYDFTRRRLTVIDLDHYSRGPIINTMGRMYGSARLMSPEELTRGATVERRSTVFTLARIALWMLSDENLDRTEYRGPARSLAVIDRATAPDPADRYQDVASYVADWRSAVER
jgi:hypothetical protein